MIITGGGTAGHITPLISVAKVLHQQFPNIPIVYIGQKGDKNESVIIRSGLPIEIKRINAGKYRRYPTQSVIQKIFNFKRHLLNIRDAMYVVVGLFQSFVIIIKLKPQVIFMKGGFVGVPVGIAGGMLNKRLVTHDSDVVPGLANRLVSPFVKIHTVATDARYPYPINKVHVVGMPVRDEYYQYAEKNGKNRARKELGFDVDSKILFIGGSTQGAKNIDDVIEQVVPDLLISDESLHVIQVFGRLNECSILDRYNNLSAVLKSRLHLHRFLHDNYRYMAAADVLIGRAGATFLAEAAVLSSACIIVPAPHLTAGHQVENAAVLAQHKAVIVLEEKNMTPESLKAEIIGLLRSSEKRNILGDTLNKLEHTDAAAAIVSVLLGE